MATKLVQTLESQDLAMRRMFINAIQGPGYQEGSVVAEVFHETLALAQRRNWVHPTQLARELHVSTSNVRKWFIIEPSKRTTPSGLVMGRALRALWELMAQDVTHLETGKPTVADTVWCKPKGQEEQAASRGQKTPLS